MGSRRSRLRLPREIRRSVLTTEEQDESVHIKREIVEALDKERRKQKLSQSELARRMRTSRAVVSRLFKGEDNSMTLRTLANACVALERRVKIRLKETPVN